MIFDSFRVLLDEFVKLVKHNSEKRKFFIDNLLVRIHFIIVVIRWTGLAPWKFEFPIPGSLTSTFTHNSETVKNRGRTLREFIDYKTSMTTYSDPRRGFWGQLGWPGVLSRTNRERGTPEKSANQNSTALPWIEPSRTQPTYLMAPTITRGPGSSAPPPLQAQKTATNPRAAGAVPSRLPLLSVEFRVYG